MMKQIKYIPFIFVLLVGVLGNGFASAAVHDCVSVIRRDSSKISIEKSAVGSISIKAWEILVNTNLSTNIN